VLLKTMYKHVVPSRTKLYRWMCQGKKAVLMDDKVFLLLLSVRRSQLVYTVASNSSVFWCKISAHITKEAVLIIIEILYQRLSCFSEENRHKPQLE